MKLRNLYVPVTVLAIAGVMASCDKNKAYPIITPPTEASFLTATSGTYYVKNDPNSVFKIPVGTTTLSSSARNVTVSVTSPTGATAGTQYTLPSTTVSIPGGKVVDSLAVKGIFSGFPGTRVDTLTFNITGGDVPASSYNKQYKLVMRRYCDVISTDLTGNYANSRDYDRALTGTASASKYTASISNWTSTGPTSATVLIKNLAVTGDIGFGPFAPTDPAATGLTATLDWSNPANFTVTIPTQNYVASLYTYGQSTISGSGTFSSCDQTFTITTTVRVAAGSFTAVVSTLIK
ncbi:hypothetical protein [Sediminibacterium ginsengisoli]|uniref:DUF1735 domain-containing protein n=1 Tax=Sediminibacterium ginsengisoli TaxID=413434 RepID=A0A1T4NP28_9BACT|nr:hypothetical protein [Sediminibacterium ginsengisoli]SJZ80963.1 hypothetical protein SAMN04488132_104341 [Sediminibacterium ginsengisoli]